MSNYLSIKEAAVEFDLSECWIRRMVHQGKLPHKRVQVGDTKVSRIEIPVSALKARASLSRSRREDGRNKFVLYATPAEYAQLQKLLSDADLATPIARANPPKSS
jgi:hypothetical protein